MGPKASAEAGDLLVFPDRNVAYVGLPTRDSSGIVAASPVPLPILDWRAKEDCQVQGYPIHVRCWTVLERVLGPQVTGEQLRRL